MNEKKTFIMKDFFNFWRKCEACYRFIRKIFLAFITINFIFWAFYIPIKDRNFAPIGGIVIFLLSFVACRILIEEHKEKAASTFFFFGATVFFYSYFLIIPTGSDSQKSFLTDKTGKFKNHGSYQLFHFPFYEKNFNYDIYQQRSFDYLEAEAKIIIDFEFNFHELFKHNNQILVSENHFNMLVNSKVNLIERFIKDLGLPKKLTELQRFNDPWLKITSLKIEFKPIVLQ